MDTVVVPVLPFSPRRARLGRASAPSIETLESRRLLAFALNVNFQPSSAAVPGGYVADTGATYGSRGNGFTYGWDQSVSTFTRDRNSSAAADQRYDTLVHTPLFGTRTWELAVPNGSYNVRIVAGDPSYTDSTIRLAAEGVVVADGALSSSRHFIDATKTINVSDGKLTISNASGAVNNKICFIEVTAASSTGTPSVSIAASDSSASEGGSDTGTFKVTRSGSTTSSLTLNYTVGGGATNGADYNTLSGSVTIAAGSSSANIVVTPIDDSLVEGNESVTLTLKSASGITLGTASATVNIADDDGVTSTDDFPSSWATGPAIPKKRWESSSVAMDGKIWVFGGWMAASSTGTQQVDVFDVPSKTWSTLKNYAPIPHTHAAPAPDPANHVIYFVGGLFGSYPGTPTNRVWKFNTQTLAWSELPSMPENHSSGGAALINGKLHYFGGVLDDRETNTGKHIVLDLNNTAAGWQSGPDMPLARDHFATVVLNNKIYAIGGEFGHDKTHDQQKIVQSFDPATNTWTRLADMPIAKSHFESATYVQDGKIVCAGGQIDNYKSTDNVSMYDPATDSWSVIGKLPTVLQGPVVKRVGNEVIVTTGNRGDGQGPIGNTWIGDLI